MEYQNRFNIILPQGKAKKSFFELTDEEHREIARRIFEKVTIEAAKVGQLPVVGKYSKSNDEGQICPNCVSLNLNSTLTL